MDVHTIVSATGREFPEGSQIFIKLGQLPGHVRVSAQLPDAKTSKDFGDLPILDGVVKIPLRQSFLAYSHTDVEAVLPLRDRLLNSGVLPWIDRKDLLGGQDWALFRDRALKGSDHCLLFLSEAALARRGEFQREIRAAVAEAERRPETSNYLIPVKLGPCEPPSTLERYHYIDLTADDGFELLVKSIHEGQ